MMKKITLITLCFISILFAFNACQVEGNLTLKEAKLNLPTTAYTYSGLPAQFSKLDFFNNNGFLGDLPDGDFQRSFLVNPLNPEITDDGATLGRVLFYDPKLSINNSVSCASCHNQSLAFADGLSISKGFGGKTTARNAMSIVNIVTNRNLFWDSREQSAKGLILRPIQNHIEMGMESLADLETKIASTDYYPELFKKAYNLEEVTAEKIADAMAQFLCSMVSADSKFDQGFATDFKNFSPLELTGKDLFFSERTQCSGCHAGANFSAPDHPGGEYGSTGTENRKGTANIGLDLVSKDKGLENGRFRIPSLRNIALTAPYMHDGRFENLAAVIEHYDKGIQAHPELDSKFISNRGEPVRMNLNSLEKQALIAFLNTLTDESFITDQRFSNPFQD